MASPKAEAPGDSERVLVVGTAGHVDHGKSALVRALTGTDPDRLAEEKARGLTIDLGFAWFRLPGGNVVSFVDVPGHEDFIRNMLAGAAGVGAVLLVVAADEGPMPQTREHLSILDLLDVSQGIVALTKSDLVDLEWRQLVTEEIAELLSGTALAGAPVVEVSSATGEGLPELRQRLDDLVACVPDAADHGRARLSVDRAFKLAGFGTVVTGTLRDGCLRAGDGVELLPSGARSRARALQSHGRSVEVARPGRRTAVNLTGISTDEVARGDVVAVPGQYRPTRLLDVGLRVLAAAASPLRHDDDVVVFCGAAEVPAHVRVMGAREIPPGERDEHPAQLRLARPIVACAGDRLVIRQPSPSRTLGGGRVLDPHPRSRWRRLRSSTAARFEALASGSGPRIAWAQLAQREPCPAGDLLPCDTGLEPAARDAALAELAAAGRAVDLGGMWITDVGWASLSQRCRAALDAYHQANRLRSGMPAEQMRERLGLTPEAFAAVAARGVAEGWLARSGALVRSTGHDVRMDPRQQAAADELLERFRSRPYGPPSAKEAGADVGAEILAMLVDRGDLVSVGADVLFERHAYEAMRQAVLEHLTTHDQVTVADVRDRFDTSRKYALALLEHLDRVRVTRRVGDAHVRQAPSEPRRDA